MGGTLLFMALSVLGILGTCACSISIPRSHHRTSTTLRNTVNGKAHCMLFRFSRLPKADDHRRFLHLCSAFVGLSAALTPGWSLSGSSKLSTWFAPHMENSSNRSSTSIHTGWLIDNVYLLWSLITATYIHSIICSSSEWPKIDLYQLDDRCLHVVKSIHWATSISDIHKILTPNNQFWPKTYTTTHITAVRSILFTCSEAFSSAPHSRDSRPDRLAKIDKTGQ